MPVPPPKNPTMMSFEVLMQLTIDHPERFCRKCGQLPPLKQGTVCSLCGLFTNNTCIDGSTSDRGLAKSNNYFFVCSECRPDLKESITNYNERTTCTKKSILKLNEELKKTGDGKA